MTTVAWHLTYNTTGVNWSFSRQCWWTIEMTLIDCWLLFGACVLLCLCDRWNAGTTLFFYLFLLFGWLVDVVAIGLSHKRICQPNERAFTKTNRNCLFFLLVSLASLLPLTVRRCFFFFSVCAVHHDWVWMGISKGDYTRARVGINSHKHAHIWI